MKDSDAQLSQLGKRDAQFLDFSTFAGYNYSFSLFSLLPSEHRGTESLRTWQHLGRD
jgi:hypothetical protein